MAKPEKKIPYGRQFLDEEDIDAVVSVLRGDWLTQGPSVQSFEESLANYCGAKHAVAVANGTAALHLACVAAGVTTGDEGITSPITFLASANCLIYCGAKPVFSDIDPYTWNIMPGEIEKGISPKTKVVIPVHFAGLPCDMDEIRGIADKHGLVVIEDACHALGASYGSKRIGTSRGADMVCFSFHPVKHITTGEGGAILTNDATLAARLRRLRHHGITNDRNLLKFADGPWYHEAIELGYNARITDIQCALGQSQLTKLDRFLDRRRKIAQRYRQELADIPGLRFQKLPLDRSHAYHLCVACFEPDLHDRLEIFNRLRAKGIATQVHYIPLYRHPAIARVCRKSSNCPNTEEYYAGCLSLPIFPMLTEEDQSFVLNTIREVCR